MKKILMTIPFVAAGTMAARCPGEQPALAQSDLPDGVRKPNVIFILADDMGYECAGAYGGTYYTPNLDRIAEQGVRFTHAWSQPLSTPTRVQAMTGRYNHKNYVDFGFLNQDQKTFGNLAQMAGYATAIAGKWQLGANSALPAHFGFDSYCLWQLTYRRSPGGERYADALIEQDGRILDRAADNYGPDMFADYVDDFIEKNRDRPFMLYYPMVLVHDPFVSTPLSDDWSTNPEGRRKSNPRYFADMMEYCDRMVGRLVDKLRAEGIYDDTLIIFAGDNGTNVRITSTMQDGTEIRGGKGLTTDAGTRVAMITSWGSGQTSPRVCDDLVDMTDIMPTVAQAMGISVPEEWDTDGVSFLPQIMGEKGTPRKWVFCHYDNFFQGPDKPDPKARRYIRDHRYKLYSTGEFYDLSADIFESSPIAAGAGTREAESARKFLSDELAGFPAWKVGDIPVKQVTLPGLEVDQLTWEQKSTD
jgi:arylsulfatase A